MGSTYVVSSVSGQAYRFRLGLVKAPVTVKAPGGTLHIDINEAYDLTMAGPVAEVGRGSLSPSFLREMGVRS